MKLRVLSFLFLLSGLVFPQEYSYKYYFDHYQGKPATFSTFEDKRGFLWFCMSIGVHTFDGINMKEFFNHSGLLKKNVFTGMQDSKGNYWFGTTSGAVKYDGFKLKASIRLGKINSLVEDPWGSIWAAGDKCIARFYKEKWTKITSAQDGLDVCLVKNVTRDSKGNVWFIDRAGILRYDGKSFSKFYQSTMGNAIYCDRMDNLWFVTHDELIMWDGRSFHSLLKLESYDIKAVFSIYSDSRGNTWLCTDNGLFRYEDHVLTPFYITSDSYFKSVFSIYESTGGVLWASMLTGICKMTPKNYEIFDYNDGLNINLITGISRDNSGNLWLFSYKGGACKYNGTSFSRNLQTGNINPADIVSVCAAKDGSVWFGTSKNSALFRLKNGKLSSLPPVEKMSRIEMIFEDSDGKIWFYNSDHICYYDGKKVSEWSSLTRGKNEKISLFSMSGGRIWLINKKGIISADYKVFIPQKPRDSKKGFDFSTLAVDQSGNIWLGTLGDGILRYLPEKNTFEHITTKQGLIDDYVTSAVFDKQNNLWIGTRTGLSEFNTMEYERSGKTIFRNFDSDDGFPRCNADAILCDKEGNIWIGVLDKLARISLQGTKEPFLRHQPGVFISDVSFLYDTTNVLSFADGAERFTGLPVNLRLPYDKNYLKISFSGIDYASPEDVQYQYKLIGQDSHWSPLSRYNEAVFRNLEPGNYTLMVIARSKDGLWSPRAAAFSFTVLPPFWRTWWFFLTVTLVLIGLIFSYIRLRTSGLEKLVALRTMELKEEKQKVENVNSELEKSRYQLVKINELQAKWLDDLAESERYLKEVNSSKDKFFSIISHDLKSPFNALLTYSESMLSNIDQLSREELKDFTVKVSRYSRNVYNLVENLLDWSRIQTGRIEYNPVEMEILPAIKDSIMVQEASASKKKIALINRLNREIKVFADKYMVSAILNNLISNGIKFTQTGGRIEISAECEDGFARLMVSDTGIGMQESEIARLFKIDSHFFKNGTMGEKGTGLGLILCKELIEKNGGVISVDSKPGQGSAFSFTLPLA
ncbi:MAG: hypothetical protein HF314_12785 [Ignavibacteria bacterium]|jgi:signal transduction histidine kinase/ligand-binding sensor domain-containing protein|nr:hypothetical protein [Ignavibacteria bacterium]MCU7503950.1 hypothetical protein [Ignavibacteria bacterium]MCU7515829.1 hypothetical protein [Ignavibacteria bacterium]